MVKFPNKKYNIIYADPPWHFQNYSNEKSNSNVTQHYQTMTFKDIKALPVQDIAADDCILFMWCTDPLLPKQLEVVEAWGFKYKTVGFYWIKENKNKTKSWYWKGTGYWTRANPEICVIATKGKPKRIDFNVDKLTMAVRDRHSRKPDVFRKKITTLMGDIPRIELFARETAEGWDSWGNEV